MSSNHGGGQGGGVLAYYGPQAGVANYGRVKGFVGSGGAVKQETIDSGPPRGGQGQHQGASGQQGGQVQQGRNKSYGSGYGGKYKP